MTHTLTLLGRVLGKYRNREWYFKDAGGIAATYYDFEPLPTVPLPQGALGIDYEYGTLIAYSDEGAVLQIFDMHVLMRLLEARGISQPHHPLTKLRVVS